MGRESAYSAVLPGAMRSGRTAAARAPQVRSLQLPISRRLADEPSPFQALPPRKQRVCLLRGVVPASVRAWPQSSLAAACDTGRARAPAVGPKPTLAIHSLCALSLRPPVVDDHQAVPEPFQCVRARPSGRERAAHRHAAQHALHPGHSALLGQTLRPSPGQLPLHGGAHTMCACKLVRAGLV
jgi:hypothetical protein